MTKINCHPVFSTCDIVFNPVFEFLEKNQLLPPLVIKMILAKKTTVNYPQIYIDFDQRPAHESKHFRTEFSNNVLIHKVGSKQCIASYHPVSLLIIGGKTFERHLIQFFSFLSKTNYFSRINLVVAQMAVAKTNYSQLSFVKNQLLIIYNFIADFNESSSLEVRPIFLDISKPMDKD